MNQDNVSDTATGRTPADSPWWNTPGLPALVGLFPLLVASNTLATGAALGIGSLAVLCASNVLVSALAGSIPSGLRVPAFLVLVAALVTAVDLLFQAHWSGLYGQIGLFVPLIATNSAILARAGPVAMHRGWWRALLDGVRHGAGCTLLLGGLGALRELLAPGLLVAALPAGALFLLAALIAARQAWPGPRGKP